MQSGFGRFHIGLYLAKLTETNLLTIERLPCSMLICSSDLGKFLHDHKTDTVEYIDPKGHTYPLFKISPQSSQPLALILPFKDKAHSAYGDTVRSDKVKSIMIP